MSSLKHWVWLSSSVGSVVAVSLLTHFGSPERVYSASAAEYGGVQGIKRDDISKLTDKNLSSADDILSSCVRIGCRIITIQDAEYPDRLKNTYDPPLILYVRGRMPIIDDEAAVAIVGTRNCTPYGLTAADEISCSLAKRGLLVVTGLARGIDTAAARGALRGGGRVVGVIGSGLDVVYPPENRQLFEDVARDGAVISEYPPGTKAYAWNFPARNRILSGLSLGVAVLEAPVKSGALITATRALEQGRDVFAMPGNINARNSEGSNALLREGAIPLLSADNIIEEYAELYPDKILLDREAGNHEMQENLQPENDNRKVKNNDENVEHSDTKKEIDNETAVEYIDVDQLLSGLEGDEKTVAEVIGTSVLQTDEIVMKSKLSASQVLTALTMLELKGYCKRDAGGYFRLVRS